MTASIDQLLDEHGGRGESKESGVSTDRELWVAALADITDLRTKFAALLAKLDSEITLEEVIELLNDLKAQYNAHRVLTGSSVHINSDAVNVVTAADAVDQATAYTLANDLKTQLNAHAAAASEVEEAITLLNDLRTQYEAHRVLVGGGEHLHADATNALAAPAATDEATAWALANDLKAKYNLHCAALSEVDEAIVLLNEIKVDYEAHRVLIAGGVHGAADAANVVTAPDATDEASAYTLANDLKTQYEAHRVYVVAACHGGADATNVIAAANATTTATLIALANELQTDYEAHRILTAGPVHGAADTTNVVTSDAVGTAAVHEADDGTNTIAAADATTHATLKTLANELRTDYTAHIAETDVHPVADATNVVSAVAVGSAGVHLKDDSTNVVASADATTAATLKTLANELRTDYEAHRQLATSHTVADATNVATEPAASTDYAASVALATANLQSG